MTIQKYNNVQKIKMLTKRQLMRFNYENHLNNSEVLSEYNDYTIKKLSYFDWKFNKAYSNQFKLSEKDIIRFFFNSDTNNLHLKNLIPIFILYGFGMILSIIVFCLEMFHFFLWKRNY